jgi:hypothetical protein
VAEGSPAANVMDANDFGQYGYRHLNVTDQRRDP